MSDLDLSPVRQAYRYVVAYQQRLRDGLFELDQSLVELGFTFNAWSTLHFGRPPGVNTAFFREKWAWDFVPMYAMRFLWVLAPWGNEAGQVYVWVEHHADTGYIPPSQGEPDPLTFEPCTQSQTLLCARWLALLRPVAEKTWKPTGNPWEMGPRHFAMNASILWPSTPGTESGQHRDETMVTGGLCVSVEDLASPTAFREQLSEAVIAHVGALAQ